jgi:hypothetical protein
MTSRAKAPRRKETQGTSPSVGSRQGRIPLAGRGGQAGADRDALLLSGHGTARKGASDSRAAVSADFVCASLPRVQV